MNYSWHYDRLISRAKDRRSPVECPESHHIVPRCLGGNDTAENRVVLTAPEHYTAHLLLVRMHPGHRGLAWAAIQMASGQSRNVQRRSGNKLYGWLRKEYAACGWKESTRQKQSAIFKGRTFSEESKRKMSLARSGKTMPAETRARIGATKIGIKRAPFSEETRMKMSVAKRGKPWSAARRSAS